MEGVRIASESSSEEVLNESIPLISDNQSLFYMEGVVPCPDKFGSSDERFW